MDAAIHYKMQDTMKTDLRRRMARLHRSRNSESSLSSRLKNFLGRHYPRIFNQFYEDRNDQDEEAFIVVGDPILTWVGFNRYRGRRGFPRCHGSRRRTSPTSPA